MPACICTFVRGSRPIEKAFMSLSLCWFDDYRYGSNLFEPSRCTQGRGDAACHDSVGTQRMTKIL